MDWLVLCLYEKLKKWKIPIWGYARVEKDLIRLHPDKEKEELCRVYYVKKLKFSILICLVGIVLSLVLAANAEQEKILQEDGTIVRGSYADGDKEIELATILESGDKQRFQVTVGVKTLTGDELQKIYEDFVLQLPQLICGENNSLQEVTSDLQLLDSYEDFPFLVEWQSHNLEVVTSTGYVEEVEEAIELELEATIFYEELEWREKLEIKVVPPLLSQTQRIHRQLEGLLRATEQATRKEEVWLLPEDYEGQELVWEQTSPKDSYYLFVGSLVTAILLFVMSDKDLHDSLENKRLQMKRAYPDVVQKLVLYLGAGLTIRGAFQRMAVEYERELSKGGRKKPLYEEMLVICREMQAGVSEQNAYENFGRRTGVQEYVRLSTLLVQNLKKGNNLLTKRLREETLRACEERLLNSKRLGEEAGTKLLLPMIMMLVVVMLMIMIPAFSSTGV